MTLADGFLHMREKLGPVFNLKVLWGDVIFTTCPEHIKLILTTDFNNYVKGLFVTILISSSI